MNSHQSAAFIDSAHKKAREDALLSSIGEAVIATDDYGNIMKVNQVVLDLFGCEESDLLDKRYLSVVKIYDIQGKPVDLVDYPVIQAIQEGGPVSSHLQYSINGSALIPVSITASPVMFEGQPVGTIQVIRDITQELEIDRAKTEFVSLASHQLRTPLTAIRWHIDLLLAGKMGKLTKHQSDSLEEVRNVNLRLIELVGALLSVARIEIGTLNINPVSSNIVKLARETVAELMSEIKEKKLHITEEYDPSIPPLMLDQDLVHIIFQNLLTNAVKYTPDEGSINLLIEKKDQHILIKVVDTGYGVPKHQQERLFTKLFRADNVRLIDPAGTGLGLYIVRSIVDGFGGEIWLESEENKGTTFFITIPLDAITAPDKTEDAS